MSFIIDTATDVTRVLSGTDTGLVTEFGQINTGSRPAVRMSGTSSLTVEGQVFSNGPLATVLSGGSVGLTIEVAASGYLAGGAAGAINVTFLTAFTLMNAGSIVGLDNGLVTLTGGALTSVAHISNSGIVRWSGSGNGTAGFTLNNSALDLVNSGEFTSIGTGNGADRVENLGLIDALTLAGGADVIINRAGAEVRGAVDLGAGNDRIVNMGTFSNQFGVAINMGDGRDQFLGLTGHAGIVYGGKGNDILRNGSEGRLYGGNGNDVLISSSADGAEGFNAADLFGGAGNDKMTIARNGTMTGGTGSDDFILAWSAAADWPFGSVMITDFDEAADRLDLSSLGFADVAEALSHFVQGSSGVAFDYAVGPPGSETFAFLLMVEGALPLTVADMADALIV